MKKHNLTLKQAWNKKCELYIEGNKLHAAGDKLQTEGDLIWLNTVLRMKGNIGLDYRDWDNNMDLYKTRVLETHVFLQQMKFLNIKNGIR